MPPLARQSKTKELEALKKQLEAQSRVIAAKDEELSKLKEEVKARDLEGKDDRIPIPEGQAGRGEGYNLFEEMKVSKETYHALRTLIRHKLTRYLDITKSLRRQDKSKVRAAKLEIAKQVPFLIKHYHAAWPIGPIIKQFLWSSSKSHKKAKAYLKHVKEVPAANGRAAVPITGAQNGHLSDDSEDELDAPTRSKTSKPIPLESTGSTSIKTAQKSSKSGAVVGASNKVEPAKPKKPNVSTVARSVKFKEAALAKEPRIEDEGPTVVLSGDSSSELSDEDDNLKGEFGDTELDDAEFDIESEDTESDKERMEPEAQSTKGKFPLYCPNYDGDTCKDKFPVNPSARIKALFQQIHDLRRNPNIPKHATGEPKGLNMKIVELCLAIATENKFRINKVYSSNWPTNIDFPQLHNRILKLNSNEIWGLLSNSIVLRNAVAWQTFLRTLASGGLNPTLFKWANMPAMQKFDVFGQANLSGYYGLAGQQIVMATLQYHIFSQDKGAVNILAETMGEILDQHSHLSESGHFWSRSTRTTLSLLDFICYVAVPHVVNMLISMDLSVKESEANKVRLDSCEYGSYFRDTTEEIDDLVIGIAKCQQPIQQLAGNLLRPDIEEVQVGPSQLPGRLARKNSQMATSDSDQSQKRSRDENDQPDLAAQTTTKKQKKMPRSSGKPLRRSARHKDKVVEA